MTINSEDRGHLVPPVLLKIVTIPYAQVQDGTLGKLVDNLLDEPFAAIVLTKTTNASVSVYLDVERAYYTPNEVDEEDQPKTKKKFTRPKKQCPHCGVMSGNLVLHIRFNHSDDKEKPNVSVNGDASDHAVMSV